MKKSSISSSADVMGGTPVSIETLQMLAGSLPRRALVLVLDWAALHQQELKEDWELCRRKEQPRRIQPLD